MFVAHPRLAERLLQLFLLVPNEQVHQREMNRGESQRGWRSQQQRRAEENEHVAAEIERVAREAVRPRRDKRLLRNEGNHLHPVHVEVERGPHPDQEADGDEQPTKGGRNGGMKTPDALEQIYLRAEERDTEPHGHDADVVKDALKKARDVAHGSHPKRQSECSPDKRQRNPDQPTRSR
jgi:hypothetical protein